MSGFRGEDSFYVHFKRFLCINIIPNSPFPSHLSPFLSIILLINSLYDKLYEVPWSCNWWSRGKSRERKRWSSQQHLARNEQVHNSPSDAQDGGHKKRKTRFRINFLEWRNISSSSSCFRACSSKWSKREPDPLFIRQAYSKEHRLIHSTTNSDRWAYQLQ